MDKTQTPPGRDGGDEDAGKKEYYGKPVKAKDAADDAEKELNRAMNNAHKNKARKMYELADRLSKVDTSKLNEQQLVEHTGMIKRLGEELKAMRGVAEGQFFKSDYTFAKDSPVWNKTIGGGAGTETDPYTAKFGAELRVLAVCMRSLALQMAGKDPGNPDNFGPTDHKLYYKFNNQLYIGDGTNEIMLANKQGVAEGAGQKKKVNSLIKAWDDNYYPMPARPEWNIQGIRSIDATYPHAKTPQDLLDGVRKGKWAETSDREGLYWTYFTVTDPKHFEEFLTIVHKNNPNQELSLNEKSMGVAEAPQDLPHGMPPGGDVDYIDAIRRLPPGMAAQLNVDPNTFKRSLAMVAKGSTMPQHLKTVADAFVNLLVNAPDAAVTKLAGWIKGHNKDTPAPAAARAPIGDMTAGALADYKDAIAGRPRETVNSSIEIDEAAAFTDAIKAIRQMAGQAGQGVRRYMAPTDQEELQDLQKRMGIPQGHQHGKPAGARPNESVDESIDTEAYDRLKRVFDFSDYKG